MTVCQGGWSSVKFADVESVEHKEGADNPAKSVSDYGVDQSVLDIQAINIKLRDMGDGIKEAHTL